MGINGQFYTDKTTVHISHARNSDINIRLALLTVIGSGIVLHCILKIVCLRISSGRVGSGHEKRTHGDN